MAEFRMNKSQRAGRGLFLVMAGLLAGSMGVMYWVGQIALVSTRTMSTQQATIDHLHEALSTLKDAETGQRGYLLTGEERYLDPYKSALARLPAGVAELERLASIGDLQEAQVRQLVDLTRKKFAELDQTQQLRREQGQTAALAVVASGQGQRFMDDIRSLVRDMEAQELAQHQQALARANWAARVRTMTAIAMGLVNLGFLGWAYQQLAREMRHKEDAVLETERQKDFLASTLASIGEAVIVTDVQGRITLLNGEAERLTGWNSPEAVGRPLSEVFRIIHEHTRHPVEDPVQRVLRLGKVTGLSNHTILIAKDGREIPIGDSGAPVKKGDEPVQGAVLVFRDVTLQRQVQQARERLAAIVEFSEDAILSKNLDGTIQTWNAGAERMFGYTAEEAVGKPITLLLPPERADEETQITEGLRRGQSLEHLETVRLTKDGRRLDVSVSVSPLKDEGGQVIGASKIVRDITERLQAQKALQQSEADLSRAQKLGRIGSWRLDVRANRLHWSDEVYRIFGLPKEQALTYESFLAVVHPEDREAVDQSWQAALQGRSYDIEHRIVVEGVVKWVCERAELEFDPEGTLQGGFGTVQDVTQLKQAERVLREREERRRAEERIKELNNQLARRIGELAAANAELETFSYSVSHDLRAPLRQVSSFADLLRESAGKLDPVSAEYLQLIQNAIRRMGQLIADLLRFSRTGRAELKRTEVNLNELVDQVRQTLAPATRDRTIDWQIHPLPTVCGDNAMLRQVLANLLENALKFSRRRPRAEVEIGCESTPTEHTFFVRDNGVGFDPSYADRLFGVFQRLHKAADSKATGIGLANVRRIVQRHGGRTWAESQLGQGATFYFTLPVI